MPPVTTSAPQKAGLVFFDTHQNARIGRWCYPPLTPDRCYTCFDDSLVNYPAEGYISADTGLQQNFTGPGRAHRFGICRRCRPDLAKGSYRGGIAETVFYFSGVAGADELSMLQEAGVSRIMVDQFDYHLVDWSRTDIDFWQGGIALDCGAYRICKSGGKLSLDFDDYMELATTADDGHLDFVVSPDVIDNPHQTRVNWLRTLAWLDSNLDGGLPETQPLFVPTWHWGSDRGLLDLYLAESWLVGIGGLVPLMREKDEAMLAELTALCEREMGRLHIFGCNWCRAIEQLAGLAASMDSSKWLDGARYGSIIFKHTRDGHLHAAPARYIPEYKDLDRRGRCVAGARNIELFIHEKTGLSQPTATKKEVIDDAAGSC